MLGKHIFALEFELIHNGYFWLIVKKAGHRNMGCFFIGVLLFGKILNNIIFAFYKTNS